MTTNSVISPLMETYNRFPVNIEKGKGSYVWDDKGEPYLDFTAGIGTCGLGHVPDVVKHAVSEQLENLWHCSNLYPINQQKKLADLLTKHSYLDQAFFCNSGSEANEAAIKLARLYHNDRSDIVTFKQSFHGRTLATLSATGQEKIQTGFNPLPTGFTYLPYNDQASLYRLKEDLPAAVMLELVQGEGGVNPAEQTWIDQLVTICREQDILLIIDEVQTGMGRTGSLFAHEQYGFEPDIVTSAKSLGSGIPIGAMLAKQEVAKNFQPGTHGSTFGGNPLAATAGLATVTELTRSSVLQNVVEKGEQVFTYLKQLQQEFPVIRDVRGRGLLIGIEMDDTAAKVVKQAIQENLLVLTAGESIVRLLPPLTVTEEEVTLFMKRFRTTLENLYHK